MKCPNCHGEIEDNLATCSMCNYILDYDKVNLDKDLDKISKTMFIIGQDLGFLIKLGVLLFLTFFAIYAIYNVINEPFIEENIVNLCFPILVILACVVLLIITIKGKRRWR